MADKHEIADEIEALTAHCRPPLMEAGQRAMWLRDWCEDLAGFPIEAIRQACRKYRHSGAVKFPTPGQLIPLVREAEPGPKGERVEVWRELSDAEYGQLTVREKIRHHLILAHEAGGKAGPMFRNVTVDNRMNNASAAHLTTDEMPPIWRTWKEREAHHMAEVKRLRAIIRTPMAAE
jgi:hypothetical protein